MLLPLCIASHSTRQLILPYPHARHGEQWGGGRLTLWLARSPAQPIASQVLCSLSSCVCVCVAHSMRAVPSRIQKTQQASNRTAGDALNTTSLTQSSRGAASSTHRRTRCALAPAALPAARSQVKAQCQACWSRLPRCSQRLATSSATARTSRCRCMRVRLNPWQRGPRTASDNCAYSRALCLPTHARVHHTHPTPSTHSHVHSSAPNCLNTPAPPEASQPTGAPGSKYQCPCRPPDQPPPPTATATCASQDARRYAAAAAAAHTRWRRCMHLVRTHAMMRPTCRQLYVHTPRAGSSNAAHQPLSPRGPLPRNNKHSPPARCAPPLQTSAAPPWPPLLHQLSTRAARGRAGCE